MATTRKVTKPKECVITVNTGKSLACGYTRVRVLPKQYLPITIVSNMTSRTIQDVVEEMLQFAIENTVMDINGERVSLSEWQQGGTR
jgi:hypothetical protein